MSQGAMSVKLTHARQLRKLPHFDYSTVKNSQQGAEDKILVGAGPRGEMFARVVHRKRAKLEYLQLFLEVPQTHYGNIPLQCDQEECLREVVLKKAGRLRLPTGVTAVEQCQANGRAEQRVRALRERLQIMVGDARRRAETILDNLVAQWAVGHAERSQNFVVKADVDMSGGGTINTTQPDAHTGDNAPSNVVGSSFSKQNQRSLTAHFLVD